MKLKKVLLIFIILIIITTNIYADVPLPISSSQEAMEYAMWKSGHSNIFLTFESNNMMIVRTYPSDIFQLRNETDNYVELWNIAGGKYYQFDGTGNVIVTTTLDGQSSFLISKINPDSHISTFDLKGSDGSVFFSPPIPPLAQCAENIPAYVGGQAMMILIASGTLLVGVLGTLLIRRLVYSYLR